jgi:hypothetical protein
VTKKGENNGDPMTASDESMDERMDATFDRVRRDILNRMDEQFSTFTFVAVLAIVGISLSVGLGLIASLI